MSRLDTGGATRETFDLPGHAPVAALRSGPRDGTPVLLLPGFTGSKEDFAPLLDPLGAAGLAVTAIDLPGQYESPGPDDPEAYRPARLATAVLAVAEALGPRVHLVGHSFGGLVARAAVLAAPDRFATLVLLCSGPAGIDGGRRERIERLRPVLAAGGLAAVHAAAQAAEAAEPGYVPPPAPVAAFLERRFLAGSEAMLAGMGDALVDEPDLVAELAATGVATLVAHGADDDAWPPALQREMAGRLGARYEVIEAAAHSPAVENPAGTLAVLRTFWASAQPHSGLSAQPRTGSSAAGSATSAS